MSGAAELAAAMGASVSLVTARQAWSRCYIGRLGAAIATYGWVSLVDTPIREIEAILRPGPGEAYVWDCVTLPAFRRQGFYRGLLLSIATELARLEVRRVWIATLERNRRASRGVARAGFNPVLRVAHLRLLSRRWYWIRGAPGARPQDIEAGRQALMVGQGRGAGVER